MNDHRAFGELGCAPWVVGGKQVGKLAGLGLAEELKEGLLPVE